MTVDVEALRAAHSLPAVMRRCGIEIPDAGPGVRDEWRLHCPLPSHPPTRSPSMAEHVSGRMAGRWHCFAGEAGGDCVAFVSAYAQVGFLRAVNLIEAGGAIPRGEDRFFDVRPATVDATGALRWQAAPGSDREAPDPARTPPERLYAATAEAWRYYSLPRLAAAAGRYLELRGIDLEPLELRERRLLVGHTPVASWPRPELGKVGRSNGCGRCWPGPAPAWTATRPACASPTRRDEGWPRPVWGRTGGCAEPWPATSRRRGGAARPPARPAGRE